MIEIYETIKIIKNIYPQYDWKIDEFKPNELVFVYTNFFKNNNFELCIELTKKCIGVTKLDKRLKIDFSLNDIFLYSSNQLIIYLDELLKNEEIK